MKTRNIGLLAIQLRSLHSRIGMSPRLSGDNVARGLIGDKPVGRSAELGLLSLSYAPGQGAWRADASLNYFGRRPANAANTGYTSGNSTLAFGLRYAFKLGAIPEFLRCYWCYRLLRRSMQRLLPC